MAFNQIDKHNDLTLFQRIQRIESRSTLSQLSQWNSTSNNCSAQWLDLTIVNTSHKSRQLITQFQRANCHCGNLVKQIDLAKRKNGFTPITTVKLWHCAIQKWQNIYVLASREGIDTCMEKLVESSVIASWPSRVTSVHSLISIDSSHESGVCMAHSLAPANSLTVLFSGDLPSFSFVFSKINVFAWVQRS